MVTSLLDSISDSISMIDDDHHIFEDHKPDIKSSLQKSTSSLSSISPAKKTEDDFYICERQSLIIATLLRGKRLSLRSMATTNNSLLTSM